MRSLLLFLVYLSILTLSHKVGGQNPREIMMQAYEKSKSVENGYYTMTRKMKSMTRADTSVQQSECYFRRLSGDTIFGFAFYQPFPDSTGKLQSQIFYTGKELVRTSNRDSSGVITNVVEWADHIQDIKHNYRFFEPLTSPDDDNIPHQLKESDYSVVELVGIDSVHNSPCYHIHLKAIPENDPNDPYEILKIESDYWVSIEDHYVLKYASIVDIVMNNDTMTQFRELTLDSFSLNRLGVDGVPGMSAVPPFISLTDYTPYERAPLLENNTPAPEWKLTSLQGNEVSLGDLKGQLVLIDFFYKSCMPCMQALPALQSLHEKYKDQGLAVIGIDPFDKDAEDLQKFLSKRGVTYTVLLSDNNFPKNYHVSGYPTMYLLDEKGTIILSQSGYGEGTEQKLEEAIVTRLK